MLYIYIYSICIYCIDLVFAVKSNQCKVCFLFRWIASKQKQIKGIFFSHVCAFLVFFIIKKDYKS